MPFKKDFEISNPSNYNRSDYVEVDIDIDSLNVPPELDENSLKLLRLNPGGKTEEIPYQIDYLLGKEKGRRFLTFLAKDTPPSGTDKYDKPSATFSLEEGTPQSHSNDDSKKKLWVDHFYSDNKSEGIREFKKGRQLLGVKLNNNNLCFYLCVVPKPDKERNLDINYAGAVTSLEFNELIEQQGALVSEMLSSKWDYAPKRWGQLTHVSFFPLPWQLEEFEKTSLLDKKHEVVFSNSGPIRAVVSLKIGPVEATYEGQPLFDTKSVKIKSHIYRIIYVYKDSPFYIEEIFSETCQDTSISFRPYFTALIHYPFYTSQLKRFESIPDYFALWKSFAGLHRGFGFAADAHVRQIQFDGDEIMWRLPYSHHIKCIHYFMCHGYAPYDVDLFYLIGHKGWYEKIFKPLEVIPYKKRFPAPSLDDYELGERR